MADLVLRIAGDYAADAAFGQAANAVKDLSRVLLDFAKDSVAAFEQQERADKQLALAAGDTAEAFKRQASALQETLGVSDDMVEKMQTMLLRFGEAPAEVDKTVRALLDYSAATGTDAVAATQQLLSSAQTGRQAFRELGLQYEKTGEATHDLTNITAALGKVVGGAAEADADSLAGRTHKLTEQWGELKEAFGGFIAFLESKLGVLEKLTAGLKAVQEGASVVSRFLSLSFGGGPGMGPSTGTVLDIMRAQDDIDLSARNLRGALGGGLSTTPGRTHATTTRGGAAAASGGLDTNAPWSFDALDVEGQFGESVDVSSVGGEVGGQTGAGSTYLAKLMRQQDEMINLRVAGEKKFLEQSARAQEEQFRQQEKTWEQAGRSIGMAFASSLANALETLLTGGEFDVNEFIGDMLANLFSTAASAIGSAIGPVGGIIGGIAGTVGGALIRGATRRPRKKHDGGWIDAQRYHSGTWLAEDEEPFIGQTGERVLSRRDVAAMGGPAAVDQAAMGQGTGGRVVVNVSTIDAVGVRDFFSDDGGRGFARSLRSGRGDVARLLGAGRVY